METEKNKIEFWHESNDTWTALKAHEPEKPFKKYVTVSVAITYLPLDSDKHFCMNIAKEADVIANYLKDLGYIGHPLMIVDIQVRKSVGDIPGISFFMQEVE